MARVRSSQVQVWKPGVSSAANLVATLAALDFDGTQDFVGEKGVTDTARIDVPDYEMSEITAESLPEGTSTAGAYALKAAWKGRTALTCVITSGPNSGADFTTTGTYYIRRFNWNLRPGALQKVRCEFQSADACTVTAVP